MNIGTLADSKKLEHIDTILNTNVFDILCLNETKLDQTFPISFYVNHNYIILRNDKTRKEGGLIVFIKKEYNITVRDFGYLDNFNYIFFQLKVKRKLYNFIDKLSNTTINGSGLLLVFKR